MRTAHPGPMTPSQKRIFISPAHVATKLAEFMAPTDLAGQGNWDSNTKIPLKAWLYAILFAALFLIVLPTLGPALGPL